MKSTKNKVDIEFFRDYVQNQLPQKTFYHVISVATVLEQISPVLNLDIEKAQLVGLLHDLHKHTPGDILINLANQFNIKISEAARIKPALLHGPIAAEICKRELKISYRDVYEAIFWHTTGKPELCLLGLALIYADFSEPLREHPEAAEARQLFKSQGIFVAVRFIAHQKLDHARKKPPVDPATEAFCSWLDRQVPL